MFYTPIVPPHLGDVLLAVPTRWHFALGQELLRGGRYYELYAKLADRGCVIIIDNGAAERDTPPFEDVVSVAHDLDGRVEIALPDVLEDGEATASLTCDYNALRLVPAHERLIIPQGRTLHEWHVCLKKIHRDLDGKYATIGLPKHFEAKTGGRVVLMHTLIREGYIPHYNIHLLGAHQDLISEAQICWQARSIDSGIAVAYAQHGVEYPAGAGYLGKRPSLDWTAPEKKGGFALRNITRCIEALR